MLRQRLYGDYLQTSAIFTEDMKVLSALSDPNDYAGPGHGLPHERRAPRRDGRRAPGLGAADADRRAGRARGLPASCASSAPRCAARAPDEVVVGLSPAFAHTIWLSLSGLTVAEMLRQVLAGIEEEGAAARLVQVHRTLDVGAIGSTASRLAGSGIGIGLQAKGTALIHRSDLPPLGNLELFSIAPRVDARALPRPRPQRRALRAQRRARAALPGRVERAARAELPRARGGDGGARAPQRRRRRIRVEVEATWRS